MLEVDRVRPEDKEEVLELSKEIWGGHDYLPQVFDEWVNDGGFYCLRKDGKIIALDKYTWHENRILWLEGYRVHPKYQGKGYGWKMAQAMGRIIEGLDWKAVRFMTAEANEASIHIGRKLGFQPFAYYTYLYADELEMQDVNGIAPLKEPKRAMELMHSTAEYGTNRRQYLAMWTAYDITESLVKSEVENGRCFIHESGAIAFFYPYEPTKTMSIAFIGGNTDGMRALIKYGMNLALDRGYRRLTVKSASESAIKAAKDAGMKESEIGMAIVWEKKKKKEKGEKNALS